MNKKRTQRNAEEKNQRKKSFVGLTQFHQYFKCIFSCKSAFLPKRNKKKAAKKTLVQKMLA